MTGFLRIVAMVAGGGVVWVVTASQIPSHVRLPLAGIVTGAVVTLPFGCTSFELEPYDPFCPGRHVHTGIDLAAPSGVAVHAAAGGTARVGFDPNGCGHYVRELVDAHVRLFYCHLSAVSVADGQVVSAGEVIGALGQSGRATGPHLHFEVQVNGTSIDPVAWLAN
ncbi:MAG: M23 family metallopeptidase [Candidatus Dormibacteraeota bacterium]|nr:M23 family metallopeptidase [Candidatus Dormibacteraeota bacterium]